MRKPSKKTTRTQGDLTLEAEWGSKGFMGSWYCTKCGARGGSSKLCSTEEEAFNAALGNAGSHGMSCPEGHEDATHESAETGEQKV